MCAYKNRLLKWMARNEVETYSTKTLLELMHTIYDPEFTFYIFQCIQLLNQESPSPKMPCCSKCSELDIFRSSNQKCRFILFEHHRFGSCKGFFYRFGRKNFIIWKSGTNQKIKYLKLKFWKSQIVSMWSISMYS